MGASIVCRGLYVHVPFCVKRCYYCDFNTYSLDRAAVNQYLNALRQEARLYQSRFEQLSSSPPVFDTLFIGGGTPTCLSGKDLRSILTMLRDHFSFIPDAEVTCEANPGSSNEDKFGDLREAGVNRLSIGVQSLDDGLLERIGRVHTAAEAVQSFHEARRAGFENINVDLMFGLPGQSVEQWQSTINEMLGLRPEHLSCYGLIIEEDTLFGEAFRRGRLILPEEEEELAMYDTVIDQLTTAGYIHYEVSNFSLPGYESKHNKIYWKVHPYLGLGPGAHGYWDGRRMSNMRLPKEYAEVLATGKLPIAESRTVSEDDTMDDTMIFGLRLLEGVRRDEFRQRFGVDLTDVYPNEINRLQTLGLIDVDAKRVRLTDRGLRLGNHVFEAFLRIK